MYSSAAAKSFFLAFILAQFIYLFTLGFQGFMIVERASLYGSRNILDQHRDMRMDVDNMSYEVWLLLPIMFLLSVLILFYLKCIKIFYWSDSLGTSCTWGEDWPGEHRIVWGCAFQVFDRNNILFIWPMPGWRKLCDLSGIFFLHS